MRCSQDAHLRVSSPQTGGTSPPQKSFSRSESLSPTLGSQSWGVLHQEDEPLEHLGLKDSRVYTWESQRAVGHRDSALKGCTQNLT